ncbi:unnamed protein product [Absidia cylindrospora]
MQRPPPPPPPNQFNAPPPLPPGWIEYRAQGGHPYWFNTVNQKTTWERPRVPAVPDPQHQSTVTPNSMSTTTTTITKAKKPRVKIPGTTWLLVTTDDDVEFYYDKSTKSSVWEMPKELEEPIAALKSKQQEEAKRKQQDTVALESHQESKRQKLENPPAEATDTGESTEMTEEDILWQMENLDPDELAALGYIPDEDNDETEQANIDTDTNDPNTAEDQDQYNSSIDQSSSSSPTHHQEEEEGQAIKSTVVETKNDEGDKLSDEEKVELFTQMLTEKDLSPFATWEKELPKLIADPRYNLLQPHSKRKTLFNNYCRILASEKKAVKEGTKSKAPEDDYKDLLNQMVISKMYWDDFRRKAKNDPRFKAVRESKVRETLFKDHIKQLSSTSSKSKSKSNDGGRGNSNRKSSGPSVEDRYRDLLVEQKVHVGMRWRDAKRLLEHDDRYHDIESKTLREDLFRDYLDDIQQR